MTVTSAFIGLSTYYWFVESEKIIHQVDKETHTPSDFTLEIWNIPEGANKDNITDLCMRILDESWNG